MSTIAFKTNKSIDNYSGGIRKILLEIADELQNNVQDGIGMKLASQAGDEASIYNFLKNQGYDINFKDFIDFYNDGKKMVEDNEETIKRMMKEEQTEELSDSDLEQVAGGMSWWKKLLIGVGIALLVAAVAIVTCGVAPLAIVAAEGMTVLLSTAIGTATTATYIGAGVAAAGAAGVVAGKL